MTKKYSAKQGLRSLVLRRLGIQVLSHADTVKGDYSPF